MGGERERKTEVRGTVGLGGKEEEGERRQREGRKKGGRAGREGRERDLYKK